MCRAVPAQDDQRDPDADECGADERHHPLGRHLVAARTDVGERRAQTSHASLRLVLGDVRHGFSNGHSSAATDDVAAVAILSKPVACASIHNRAITTKAIGTARDATAPIPTAPPCCTPPTLVPGPVGGTVDDPGSCGAVIGPPGVTGLTNGGATNAGAAADAIERSPRRISIVWSNCVGVATRP